MDELPGMVEQLMDDAGDIRVFAFYGAMGSGKTTIIKEICKHLGVVDHTTSPTFTIVNEYFSDEAGQVFHFDFYRIKNESEAFDLGFENYLYSGNYCFIEWPEKVSSLLPPGIAIISIETEGDRRKITLSL
jgi:tRNA threonylcarbamoyladenosine biosynthesis protein TsaE